jgi:primosomal protein N' (replication factor Y)
MPPIARVEPLTTARALRGPFDYRLPAALADVPVGTLLAVPFAGRELLGVVVERTSSSEVPPERLAEPRARVEPAIPAELVELARWIADEYCSTFSRALQLVLPPGAGRAARPRVRVREVLVAQATEAGRAALTDGVRLTDGQRTVLARLAADGPLPATETGADHGGLRRLAGRGLILLERRAQRRRPLVRAVGARSLHAPQLTDEQRAALEPILAAVRESPRV